MIRRTWWAALALAAFVGCAKPEAETPTDTPAPSSTAPADGPADAAPAEASAVSLSADELAQIEKLPEADRQAAQDQKVCAISGEHLGSMGVPIKKEVDGKPVFLCCKGCSADFDADPKAALAKVEAASAAKAP
jgi:hypothetical protein